MSELRKFVAPEFIFGQGSAELAGRYAANLSVTKVLLVTDEPLLELGWPDIVADSLDEAGVESVIFSRVSPNPRDFEVMEGAEIYEQQGCDAIVAVGGGSPMDCAKGIGIIIANGGHILDYQGVDMVPRPCPPLICIPTTSGSAADVSQFSIITDTTRKVKIAIVSKTMIPDVSLIDPEMTRTMPPELTAHTGLDALTHAVEAYVSNANSPVTDLHALEAVRLVGKHLETAIAEPDNIEARTGMSLASTYAGLAFSNAILGAVHAMAHSLGGLLDLPHGLCNAILLDHVIEYNFDSEPERFAQLGKALFPEGNCPANPDKACVLERFRELKKSAGVSTTLADLGVTPDTLAALAKTAMEDPCMLTNPRSASSDEIMKVFGNASR